MKANKKEHRCEPQAMLCWSSYFKYTILVKMILSSAGWGGDALTLNQLCNFSIFMCV